MAHAVLLVGADGQARVGLAVDLDREQAGTLRFDVPVAPYQIEVFGTASVDRPTEFDGWGDPLAPLTVGDEPGPFEVAAADRCATC